MLLSHTTLWYSTLESNWLFLLFNFGLFINFCRLVCYSFNLCRKFFSVGAGAKLLKVQDDHSPPCGSAFLNLRVLVLKKNFLAAVAQRLRITVLEHGLRMLGLVLPRPHIFVTLCLKHSDNFALPRSIFPRVSCLFIMFLPDFDSGILNLACYV